MSETQSPPVPYRRDTACPFGPAPEVTRLRTEQPVTRVSMPFQTRPTWLVTRYEDVRALLRDERVTNTRADTGPTPGDMLSYDPPEHSRLRRMLTGHFTVKRVNALRPRIEELVTGHLDAMERNGPPCDLVTDFALPIPSLVICELLGVPKTDQARFQDYSNKLLDVTLPPEERGANDEALKEYMAELVAEHRRTPGENMLGALVRDHGDELSDEELVGVGTLLLIAGHETTSNMLGLGTLLLLDSPEQLAVVRDDENAAGTAVEEMLRYLSVVSASVPRRAAEDFTFGDHLIRAGDTIQCSLMAANRDPALLEEPDRFDVTRKSGAHTAFGHGIHQCLGQQLARLEMRVAYPALLRRFPGLRLAVPPEQLRYRDAAFVYGLWSLPLTW